MIFKPPFFGRDKEEAYHAPEEASAKTNEEVEAKPASAAFKKAHVIVVGNEKGGSGKTTTTMHLIVALLRQGFTVGSMDIDSRQRSLSRYVENRRETVSRQGVSLPLPHHIIINRSPFNMQDEAIKDEQDRFAKGLAQIYGTCDFVVIDTPGADSYLSRLAHSFADTVITPINDSFVDLDVLASVNGHTLQIIRPSIYSEMVWEQKLSRAKRDGGSIDWIVMRNRLSNIDARNKRFMTKVTEDLSKRIGFRLAPGFSERVIFREMFLQGLTVLDVMEENTSVNVSMSHVAARQEVRDLLKVLNIPILNQRLQDGRETKGEPEAPQAAEAAATQKSEPVQTESKPAEEKAATPPVTKQETPAAPVSEKPAPSVASPEAESASARSPLQMAKEALETLSEKTSGTAAPASPFAAALPPQEKKPQLAVNNSSGAADTAVPLTEEKKDYALPKLPALTSVN